MPHVGTPFMNTGPTKTWGCFDLRREARVSLASMLMSFSSLDSCEILMHCKGLSGKFLAFAIHGSYTKKFPVGKYSQEPIHQSLKYNRHSFYKVHTPFQRLDYRFVTL